MGIDIPHTVRVSGCHAIADKKEYLLMHLKLSLQEFVQWVHCVCVCVCMCVCVCVCVYVCVCVCVCACMCV